MIKQVYNSENVLEATQKRIAKIFNEFEHISVSISGGKDSTVMAHLMAMEAKKRGRKIDIFFADEEVYFMATIEQVRWVMNEMCPEAVNPIWYQFPFFLANSSSLLEGQLLCWDPSRKKVWMREKEPNAVTEIPWDPDTITVRNKAKGLGFYAVLDNYEHHQQDTCFCVGLRATESPNRFRAVSKNPGYVDANGEPWYWTTKQPHNCIQAYPIYDWNFADVWHYIYVNNIRYSKMYDYMWKKGFGLQEIRCSSLTHAMACKSLVELPEFEPETYDRLLDRLSGITTGHLYGKDAKLLQAKKLPRNFKSWMEYRDFLLDTYPYPEYEEIFRKRFAKHKNNNYVARQECRQLLLNDYENEFSIKNTDDPREKTLEKWRNIL